MDRETLIRLAEKRQRIEAHTDANLIYLLKVNRVYGASLECQENIALIERELAWRRQGDGGPFR